jgi:hypothetical protein
MGRPDLERQLDAIQEQVVACGEEFASAAEPILIEALERSVERLVVQESDWLNGLGADTLGALRRSVVQMIRRSARATADRLRDPDLWLAPTVSLDHPPTPELDQPNNRAWIRMLRTADGLDAVLVEFGLQPSDLPDPGGAHFGLQPQSIAELDLRGTLTRLWRRYLGLFERHQELIRRIPEEKRGLARDQALRRWRDPE